MRLPFAFVKAHRVFFAANQQPPTLMYTTDTESAAIYEAIRVLGNTEYAIAEIDDSTFDRYLQSYGDSDDDTDQVSSFASLEATDDDLDQASAALRNATELLEHDDDAPIIRLINVLLTRAIRTRATDIHIETYEQRLRVRFRIDGVLQEVLTLNPLLAGRVVSRIKVMAQLDIAEKRLPQDGRFSIRLGGRPIDVRVATIPSGHNEKAVLRLLDKHVGQLSLSRLGMTEAQRAQFSEAIKNPHGIILVTGPTGAGKTTTLYAALSTLNNNNVNIMTVEDPIEFSIDGVNQSQVNTRVDMSFAKGLRAILRQDPDIVMVGEIRDLETARTAIQASLTGHLVFSTLHTNTAIGVISRLRDMGVEPFLLSSSLVGVLAQRLLRRLCESCRRPHVADTYEKELLQIDSDDEVTLYQAVGCTRCHASGYSGRVGVFEWLPIDATLKQMIYEQRGEHEMAAYARQHTTSLADNAIGLVVNGMTTIEEMLTITRSDR